MYRFVWDIDTGGILLNDLKTTGKASEIRPVFCQELDLLGFDAVWKYPASREPLLWARGRRYYYRGREVARAKGGAFFEAPDILLEEEGLCLKPVDVEAMVKKNAPLLESLASRAIEFIRRTYEEDNWKDSCEDDITVGVSC